MKNLTYLINPFCFVVVVVVVVVVLFSLTLTQRSGKGFFC